ncbi:MAG: acyl-CoA dehydrogenase family protein [Gammaproteobacteria bacterium]|nr:acyl-CoA dehydrogenase family protein [Gammaproteobacteria bacterium]
MNLLDGPDSILRDSIRRALADMAPHATLTADGADPADLARRHWEAAAGLGWLDLVDTDEADVPAGREELLELAEELGAGLFCGPFLAGAVLAPSLSRTAGGPGQVPDADGATTCLASPLPGESRWLLEHPDLASRALLVDCARTGPGAIRVQASLVPRPELVILAHPNHLDPSCPLAEIEVSAGVLERRRIVETELDAAGFADLFLDANLALAGECTGVAAAVLERALDWCAERRQFGRPIGSFQAVKHKLADLYVDFRKAPGVRPCQRGPCRRGRCRRRPRARRRCRPRRGARLHPVARRRGHFLGSGRSPVSQARTQTRPRSRRHVAGARQQRRLGRRQRAGGRTGMSGRLAFNIRHRCRRMI